MQDWPFGIWYTNLRSQSNSTSTWIVEMVNPSPWELLEIPHEEPMLDSPRAVPIAQFAPPALRPVNLLRSRLPEPEALPHVQPLLKLKPLNCEILAPIERLSNPKPDVISEVHVLLVFTGQVNAVAWDQSTCNSHVSVVYQGIVRLFTHCRCKLNAGPKCHKGRKNL